MSAEGDALSFTGERFTPECEREICYEHWHRYAFARPLVAGKRVLDAACGEGYGTALLAESAANVVGVDISREAIEHAKSRYGQRKRVSFQQADAAALDFPSGSFDAVVSFETLEHLSDQEALIAGFARALSDDGILIISSPDKRTYSDATGFKNEFHVRELYREQLQALLEPHFPQRRMYGQKLLFQSAMWPLNGDGEARTDAAAPAQVWTAASDGTLQSEPGYAPLYFVVVCAKRALPEHLPGLSLFGDAQESVYAHYAHEIRKNMRAGGRIAELEAEVARLQNDANKR